MSQAEVASAVGIGYSTFRTYLAETDPRMPSADTGVRIAQQLGVTAEWLWDDSHDWPPPESHGSTKTLRSTQLLDMLEASFNARLEEYRAIRHRLSDARLHLLDELAVQGDRTERSQTELMKGLADLFDLRTAWTELAYELKLLNRIFRQYLREYPDPFIYDGLPSLAAAFRQYAAEHERNVAGQDAEEVGGRFTEGLTTLLTAITEPLRQIAGPRGQSKGATTPKRAKAAATRRKRIADLAARRKGREAVKRRRQRSAAPPPPKPKPEKPAEQPADRES